MSDLSLDQWLGKLYDADRRTQLASVMPDFKAALAADPSGLGATAAAELTRLDALIAARGREACAYSAKYNDYLHGALDASS